MKKLLFLFISSLLSLSIAAQTRTITGKVTDAAGEPIAGATIVEVGVPNGTITDTNGTFILHVKAGAQITVSYIGFVSQQIKVGEKNTINVVLVEDTRVLDELVVTGYGGAQLRSKVTNSISKVKEEMLSTGLYSNPAQALSGAVAGLRVIQSSGNPGATPTIVLRGGTNFDGSGSPLIIVDGQVRGSLSDINPEDIESMEVLKDAGATAIYGARANDGVVLVTTKRGKKGIEVVNLKTKVGVNHFRFFYDFMNATDYLYWMRTAYKNSTVALYTLNDGTVIPARKYPNGTNMMNWANIGSLNSATPYGTGNKYWTEDNKNIPLNGNKDNRAIWSPMKYTDDLAFLLQQGWMKMTDPVFGGEIIYKNFDIADFNIKSPSISQDYNINMSGGNDKGNYYAGIGYNDSEGSAAGDWYKRLTFQFNGDYKVKEWLTSSSTFNFADAKWYGLSPTQTNEALYFSRVLSLPSTFRGYNADGEMLLGPNASDGNQSFQREKFIRNNNTTKFTMAQSFKIDLAKGLTLKLNGNWYISDGRYEAFNKDYLNSPTAVPVVSRNSSASSSRMIDQTYNAILNYKKTFNDAHNLDAMVGYEYYESYLVGLSASGSGAPTDDFMDLEYTSNKEGMRSIDSEHTRNRIVSYISRVNYDYKDKYLASFVFRRDGYSKLSEKNRFGNFPGISAGWVFTREDFMSDYEHILSFGKLRASYGRNGNVSKDWVGNYTVQGSYGSTLYNNSVGYAIGGIANPYLIWETSNTTEAGLDLGFLKNRLTVNLTYYDRNTFDKYAYITVPSTSGINLMISNNGEFRNQGFEYEVNYRVLDTRDLKWNVSLLGSTNKNTVIKLPDNDLPLNRQNATEVYSGTNPDDPYEKIWVGGYQEGQTPGDIYLFYAEGIYKSQDEIPTNLIDRTSGNNGSNRRPLYGGAAAFNNLTDGEKKRALPIEPGDVKWRDVNGDNIIDNYDLVKIGNSTPKVFGGINTNFSYKGIKLNARFDYALGFTIVDWRTPWIMGNMQGTYNTIQDTKQTWTPENPNAKYPIYVWADQLGKRNYARNTSMFAYKGDYLAFRELTLAYSLPKGIIEKVKLTNAEVSVTGQNLGYLTEAPHVFTPEVSSINGGYPLRVSVIFGLNLSF
ncbi:MAG: SusC/RagA family TonB-linked outer membrane protein [Paludibacter sp.]|nr:SusC/RagA family TonB-linked outer membrane protein [Paludibacter sp.]MDD4427156.1 SusC/RagA family TonB-linked outer membrane protein [Paludibacter sp.]